VSAAPPPLDQAQVRATLLALLTGGQPETAVDTVLQLLTALQDHATALAQRVAQLLKQTYGRRSEQVDPAQLRLLLAALAGAPTESPAAAATAPTLPAPPPRAPRRPPTGRRPLPADLPREEQVHTPPERERHCAGCDQPKARIGVERSEVLEWLPATFKVIVHLREKYACPRCQDGVVIAPVPEKVIDGGRPGPGLLAHVLVAKYRDHVPLYRLAGIYARSGVALAPSTLGGWVAEGAELLTPVADAIYATVLDAHVLQIDDTGLRVLDRSHPGGVKKGHLWGLVGDGRLVAFAYTPSWEGAAARALVETRRGWLHADGYAGFDQLFTRPGATAVEVGCWAHTRRKFFEAMEAGDVRAALAVERIQQLYRLERDATVRGLDAAARLALRQAQATPIVDALGQWIADVHPQAPPRSLLGKALRYALNQWTALRRFLEDGALPLDTNGVERALRAIAVGRKNWLFAGADVGARRAAILYTLFGSCALCGVEPWAYARDVLEKVSGTTFPQSRLPELLPDRWGTDHPEARIAAAPPIRAP